MLKLNPVQKKKIINDLNQLQIRDAKYPIQMLVVGPINKEVVDIIEVFSENFGKSRKENRILNHKIGGVNLIKYLTDGDNNGIIGTPGSRLIALPPRLIL